MDSSDRDAHLAIARRLNKLMDGRRVGEEQGLYSVLFTGIAKDTERISVGLSLLTGCPASQGGTLDEQS